MSSGTCLRTYQGHTDGVESAVYNADGQKILSASGDKTIKEWDVISGACLRTYQGHTGWVRSAVYSADGQRILSASDDKTVKEWDVINGTCLRTYEGHEHEVSGAVYSADGQKILSASGLGIKEWDVGSGACLQSYQRHEHSVTWAVYSSDGQKILSHSIEGTFKEWEVKTGRCLDIWYRYEKDKVPFGHYPDIIKNSTYKNIFINEIDQIKIIDRQTKQTIYILKNIPGLFIQGCSFKNLHLDSQLTEEQKQLLKMYGGILE